MSDVITVTLLDFYDPTTVVAKSRFHASRWIPEGRVGLSWGYYSWDGKMLGYICRNNGKWSSIKACCNLVVPCLDMHNAALYVQFVGCTCPASVLN